MSSNYKITCKSTDIRAKVNSLRARGSKNDTEKKLALADAHKYLCLMDGYTNMLDS